MKRKIISYGILFAFIFVAAVQVFADYSDGDVVFVQNPLDDYTRWALPVSVSAGVPVITSKWNEPRTIGTTPHVGIDIGVPTGTNVYAVANGTLTNPGGAYNLAVLSTGDF
jgi:murein DD-endopeptidase MepM/ murein hydrolase activator NlpD